MLKKGVINKDSCPVHMKKPIAIRAILLGQLKVKKHNIKFVRPSHCISKAIFVIMFEALNPDVLMLVARDQFVSEDSADLETGVVGVF